jgi:hypothetical protein
LFEHTVFALRQDELTSCPVSYDLHAEKESCSSQPSQLKLLLNDLDDMLHILFVASNETVVDVSQDVGPPTSSTQNEERRVRQGHFKTHAP